MLQANYATRYERIQSILPDTIINNQYLVLNGLGKGSFGKVYLAQNYQTRKLVAIKALNMENVSDYQKQNIEQEEEILKNLNHPNIVKLQSVIKEETVTYLILDYIWGETLSDYFKNQQYSLHISQIQIIAITLLKTLKYLLKMGVVHHDIKLSNIIIPYQQDLDQLQLIDFGLATTFKQNEDEINDQSQFGGSFAFMAPELFNQSQVYNSKLDIWSIGILLYLLGNNNQHPFVNIKQNKQYIKQFYKNAKNVQLPKRNLPQKLQQFLSKILRFNPVERISVDQALKSEFLTIDYVFAPTFEQIIFESQSASFQRIIRAMIILQYIQKVSNQTLKKFKQITQNMLFMFFCKKIVPLQEEKKYKRARFKINKKIFSVLNMQSRNTPKSTPRNMFKVHTYKNIIHEEQKNQPFGQEINLDNDEASQSEEEEDNNYQIKVKKNQQASKNFKLLKYLKTANIKKKQTAVSVDFMQNQVQQVSTSGINNLKAQNKKILAFSQVFKPKQKESPIDSYFNKYSIIKGKMTESQFRFLPSQKQNLKLNYFGSSQDFSLQMSKLKAIPNQKTCSQFKLPRIKNINQKCL